VPEFGDVFIESRQAGAVAPWPMGRVLLARQGSLLSGLFPLAVLASVGHTPAYAPGITAARIEPVPRGDPA
jgi:hypothetical protein